jgi:hypothetical protein
MVVQDGLPTLIPFGVENLPNPDPAQLGVGVQQGLDPWPKRLELRGARPCGVGGQELAAQGTGDGRAMDAEPAGDGPLGQSLDEVQATNSGPFFHGKHPFSPLRVRVVVHPEGRFISPGWDTFRGYAGTVFNR